MYTRWSERDSQVPAQYAPFPAAKPLTGKLPRRPTPDDALRPCLAPVGRAAQPSFGPVQPLLASPVAPAKLSKTLLTLDAHFEQKQRLPTKPRLLQPVIIKERRSTYTPVKTKPLVMVQRRKARPASVMISHVTDVPWPDAMANELYRRLQTAPHAARHRAKDQTLPLLRSILNPSCR